MIRVIVPISWASVLRINLFDKLKALGYTWSKGDSLDTFHEKYQNMAYIAIYPIDKHIIKFGTNLETGTKLHGEYGYNYVTEYKEVDQIISVVKLVSMFLKICKVEYAEKSFVQEHNSLKRYKI